jgi:LEA14-like dessication related protein
MRLKALAILILVVIVAAAGFYINDMISSAKKISVKVDKIEIVSAGLEKVTVRVTFCIENPSGYHYSAEDIRYSVYYKEVELGNGTIKNIEIPAKTTTYKDGLFDLHYRKLIGIVGSAIVDLLINGKLDVDINGTMKVKTLLSSEEIKFSETRTIIKR